ncbi:DUF1679 domain-containing protein [Pseudoalteromonas sp. MMG010]|uniref:phosphotransferase n=1 Tax=Pseudoalteromonas sp. MMG010 TaxID=2822685 RepID=UPI001B3A48DE|nr:phosphotransferase [Pseudoalteromonas sp. MMG010]MBQ4833510.1 DUF1679 domain-containing protein [Pseudoalteromonas sp. MMG010]
MAPFLSLLKPYYKTITLGEVITELWSGCGHIVQCKIDEKPCVIKAISVPEQINHPRIKQSIVAIQRKKHSYIVEYNWYKHYSQHLPLCAQAITCLKALAQDNLKLLVFTDFNIQGYQQAKSNNDVIQAVLSWLAHFHAFHLKQPSKGLWQQGNYWHLATRPDEFANMLNGPLKQSAQQINDSLVNAQFQTIIHGDAKLANFAYNSATQNVLGYDFQYTGKGVGVIDVMYFLGSCLNETELTKYAEGYLNTYFDYLTHALMVYKKPLDPASLINEWRALWPVAWADFYRFLAGWDPTHIKINSYMQRISSKCINTNVS